MSCPTPAPGPSFTPEESEAAARLKLILEGERQTTMSALMSGHDDMSKEYHAPDPLPVAKRPESPEPPPADPDHIRQLNSLAAEIMQLSPDNMGRLVGKIAAEDMDRQPGEQRSRLLRTKSNNWRILKKRLESSEDKPIMKPETRTGFEINYFGKRNIPVQVLPFSFNADSVPKVLFCSMTANRSPDGKESYAVAAVGYNKKHNGAQEVFTAYVDPVDKMAREGFISRPLFVDMMVALGEHVTHLVFFTEIELDVMVKVCRDRLPFKVISIRKIIMNVMALSSQAGGTETTIEGAFRALVASDPQPTSNALYILKHFEFMGTTNPSDCNGPIARERQLYNAKALYYIFDKNRACLNRMISFV